MVHHSGTLTENDIAHFHPKKQTVSSAVNNLVNEICHIHRQLSETDNLKPCDYVNTLFTKLVGLCTFQHDNATVSQVLSDLRVKFILNDIRALASQGEYLLELFWANRLLADSAPELSCFVYYQNYVDLVQLELHALQGCGVKIDNIVFIGSGPLPLSSILMYQGLSGNVKINNIDRDQASIDISTRLIKQLGINQGFQQHVMEASDYAGFNCADVVILGALVGSNMDEKMKFLSVIGNHMKQGSFVMVRSAHSLRKLLYPSIEPYHVNMCGFETVLVLHPFNDVVNSVLIAKKK